MVGWNLGFFQHFRAKNQEQYEAKCCDDHGNAVLGKKKN